jgi:tRNA threonylcarbamoyladenosine modification (KEOPS) complex  Pcc1 subunit
MKVNCSLKIEFENKLKGKNILESVKVDDFDFVKSELKDNFLIANIQSNSISSLIHTLDDYLACVSVAEKVMNKK